MWLRLMLFCSCFTAPSRANGHVQNPSHQAGGRGTRKRLRQRADVARLRETMSPMSVAPSTPKASLMQLHSLPTRFSVFDAPELDSNDRTKRNDIDGTVELIWDDETNRVGLKRKRSQRRAAFIGSGSWTNMFRIPIPFLKNNNVTANGNLEVGETEEEQDASSSFSEEDFELVPPSNLAQATGDQDEDDYDFERERFMSEESLDVDELFKRQDDLALNEHNDEKELADYADVELNFEVLRLDDTNQLRHRVSGFSDVESDPGDPFPKFSFEDLEPRTKIHSRECHLFEAAPCDINSGKKKNDTIRAVDSRQLEKKMASLSLNREDVVLDDSFDGGEPAFDKVFQDY